MTPLAHAGTCCPAGADDFTPVLIYVTIKAQPEYLASNLAFIERYRMASRLVSEAQYFFVQMVSTAGSTLRCGAASKGSVVRHMCCVGSVCFEGMLDACG